MTPLPKILLHVYCNAYKRFPNTKFGWKKWQVDSDVKFSSHICIKLNVSVLHIKKQILGTMGKKQIVPVVFLNIFKILHYLTSRSTLVKVHCIELITMQRTSLLVRYTMKRRPVNYEGGLLYENFPPPLKIKLLVLSLGHAVQVG